jgi:hypothetical protein
MNRRGFLTGLLASTAIARARARVSVSIGELLDAAPVPVPRWFAITPSTAELLRGCVGRDQVEGHLGSLNGFTFKS